MTFNIGILGTGKVSLDHAKAVEKLGHKLVAGSARNTQSENWKRFKQHNPQAEFMPAEIMLNSPDIDKVIVCIGWKEMQDWLPDFLKKPKPMLLEKPVTVDYHVMKNCLEQSSNNINKKLVGLNRRYYRPVYKLKERLAEGGLINAQINISENLDALIKRWGNEILKYVLAYSSCHILDLALYLLGPLKPENIKLTSVTGYEPFNNMNGLLKTKNDIPVFLSINAFDPSAVGIVFRFMDRTVWQLSPIEKLTVYKGYDIIEPSANSSVRKYNPHEFNNISADVSFRPGFYEQMQAFTSGNYGQGATIADFSSLLEFIDKLNQNIH